jgi:hypothetical protein
MMRGVTRACAVALALLTLLSWPFLAVAQQSSLPPNVIAPSGQNSVIRNQLTLAKKLEQQAIEGFMAAPGDNSVPVDPVSLQAARDAYILIRAARHGMGWQKEAKKYPDPVFDLIYKRVEEAWNLSRTPADHSDQRERAVQDGTQAIRLLNQVLAMMP